MTVYLLGAATLILVALILWRRSSPEFRRKSEQPKFQVLANLGVRPKVDSETEATSEITPSSESKGNHEEHQS